MRQAQYIAWLGRFEHGVTVTGMSYALSEEISLVH